MHHLPLPFERMSWFNRDGVRPGRRKIINNRELYRPARYTAFDSSRASGSASRMQSSRFDMKSWTVTADERASRAGCTAKAIRTGWGSFPRLCSPPRSTSEGDGGSTVKVPRATAQDTGLAL